MRITELTQGQVARITGTDIGRDLVGSIIMRVEGAGDLELVSGVWLTKTDIESMTGGDGVHLEAAHECIIVAVILWSPETARSGRGYLITKGFNLTVEPVNFQFDGMEQS